MKNFLKNILPFNNREDIPNWQLVIKKLLAFYLCYFAGGFLGEGIVIGLLFVCGKNPLEGEMFSTNTMTLVTFYGYLVHIAIILLYWKLIEKKPVSKLGVTKKIGSYFIGSALAVVFLAVSVGIIMLTGAFEFKGIFGSINVRMIVLLFGGFIIQGAMEEFLCRGIVLQALKGKVHIIAAISASTLVFILPHLSSMSGSPVFVILGIINLVLISVIFSLLTLRFKSIWAACGLHSIWNFILYAVLGLNLSGKNKIVTAVFNIQSSSGNILNGGAYGIEASIVTAGVLLIASILLAISMKKASNK